MYGISGEPPRLQFCRSLKEQWEIELGRGRVCYEDCVCLAVFQLMALTVSQALWKVLHTHALVTSSQYPCEIRTVTVMA